MRERHGASDAACRLRFHTQTGGSTLTAQQPLNNVVRVTTQALSAVLGGTQSLHTNGYDEALTLPSAEAAKLALRTQQILAYESGVARTADPLAGSYLVEHLTDRIEEEARRDLEEIERRGGAARAIDYMQREIQTAAARFQREVESGARVVVGVNRFREEESRPAVPATDFSGLEREQRAALARVREARDSSAVERALSALASAAAGTEPLMPRILAAVRAMGTLGEISHTLRKVWGSFDPGA
jgi:methylmalonyl-CoA mutase N-terminal domain/subunit